MKTTPKSTPQVYQDNFIAKAQEKHNSFYDYTLVHYKGRHEKVKIICPIHGLFEQTVGNHLTYGCRKCGYIKSHEYHPKYKTNEAKVYGLWSNIKDRCYNPNNPSYDDYGGRNIKLASVFDKFEPFMIYVKSLENYDQIEENKLSLDRINTNGNYEPGNLRWATQSVQCINRRDKISKSGHKNIVFRHNHYAVSVKRNRIRTQLGTYNTIQEAIKARDEYLNTVQA